MKIGLFADVHYCSQETVIGIRFPRTAFQRLKEGLEQCLRESVSLIVCLGDLINIDSFPERNEENLRTVSALIASCPIPSVTLPGNHDREVFTPEEFRKISGLRTAPMILDSGINRLYFLDACYNPDGTGYQPGKVDWTRCFIPDDQLDSVRQSLTDSTRKHFFFVHQCLNDAVESRHIIANAPEVREILESGSASAVFQGHYHPGNEQIIHGIPYITLPALCEGTQSGFRIINTDEFV